MPADPSAKQYESSEIPAKRFLIGLFLLGIGAFAGGYLLMRVYNYLLHTAERPPAPRSIAERFVIEGKLSEAEAPPLQPQVGHVMVDAQDLYAMRQNEITIFDKLGWKWNGAAQRYEIPLAVIDAVQHRAAATQPGGTTSAERGAK